MEDTVKFYDVSYKVNVRGNGEKYIIVNGEDITVENDGKNRYVMMYGNKYNEQTGGRTRNRRKRRSRKYKK